MLSVDDLLFDGHRYDVRVISAALEYVALKREVERAKAAGRDPGLPVLFMLDAQEHLRAQASRQHGWTRERTDATVCTCGLVVPAGLDRVGVCGHLDPATWDRATAVVVVDDVRTYGGAPTCFTAYCQACLWTEPVGTGEQARRLVQAHPCSTGERASPSG